MPELYGREPFVVGAALYDGRPYIVNVFASWCGPCREEHPLLMSLARDVDLPLVGIAFMDDPENSREFLAELGNPYDRVGTDLRRETSITLGVVGPPYTLVFDGTGKLLVTHAGPMTESTTRRIVAIAGGG